MEKKITKKEFVETLKNTPSYLAAARMNMGADTAKHMNAALSAQTYKANTAPRVCTKSTPTYLQFDGRSVLDLNAHGDDVVYMYYRNDDDERAAYVAQWRKSFDDFDGVDVWHIVAYLLYSGAAI